VARGPASGTWPAVAAGGARAGAPAELQRGTAGRHHRDRLAGWV